jgi:hypothetical protein
VLPAPDLSALDGKTFTVNDTIVLTYDNPVTGFNWEFDPIGPGSGSTSSGQAFGLIGLDLGAPNPVSTPAPSLSLIGLSLRPGPYTLNVQAVNGNELSPWTSARITLASTDLSSLQVVPNPWRSDRHSGHPITFYQLAANSHIELFTASGHRVRSLDGSGQVSWNLDNDSGESVASGIYLYLVTDASGQKNRGKLAVIR